MHYRVNGHLIRTERTAKPRSQASAALKHWLLKETCRGEVLDFGCGRLRYGPELSAVATTLTLVDSPQQLRRVCSFAPHQETITEQAARQWPQSRALEFDAFVRDDRHYDFILCANVLSAIPLERERRKIVRLLASRLKPSGHCLFVTQYRNSYYRELENHPGATPHLDGFLVNRGSAITFYGLIPKSRLIRLVHACDLHLHEAWIEGQSAYVLCSRS